MSSAIGQAVQQTSIVRTSAGQGSRTSEGDIAHLAFAAREAFGARGKGIKIGVLSDGVTSLAASQALGDLGPVAVLPGQAGVGDEGTAMLEIIHDLAPEAQLFFAKASSDDENDGGITRFAQNIRDLRAAGCDIIVDDVIYPEETPFQDGQAVGVRSSTNGGLITQVVKEVTAEGALYFASAGNSGNLKRGFSGVWEGDFVKGPEVAVFTESNVYNYHAFQEMTTPNGPVEVVGNTLTTASSKQPITLHWSDPLGQSANDYDLFRINAAGTGIVASSTNVQDGTQDPFEKIPQGAEDNATIIILKRQTAAARFLHLDTNGGVLHFSTQGAIRGHAAVDATGAYGIAATSARASLPGPFNRASRVEALSADGPRRIFFDADGTPISDTLPPPATGTGKLLQKPDLTAADGVSVSGVGDFQNPFFGASAAAAHAAAIAALIKSVVPNLTAERLRTALLETAIDIESAGFDHESGAGILMPTEALRALGITAPALVDIVTANATDDPGNDNGAPEAGEGASLTIRLANYGNTLATGVTATLTTSTPGITIEQPSSRIYGDIRPAMAADANPIRFTVASAFPCPASASFALTVAYTGVASTRVLTFEVPIGVSSYQISKTLDGTPAARSPGAIPFAGVQTVRLNRDRIVSTCAVQKATPPLALNPLGTIVRQFEAYSFNTCVQSVASCVTVNLEGPDAVKLFAAAYSPSFSPVNVRQNYKADTGSSSLFSTFSFNLPGGGQPFAVDVHDVTPGPSSQTAYTLTVTGACMGACDPPNHVPIAKAKDVTVTAPANACGARADIDDGSFDEDGDTLVPTQSPPGPYDIGTTAVLLTVKDTKGATSQARANVTVVDNTPPQLTCPDDISVPASPGACSAPVPFSADASDTCSAPVSVVSTPPSGSIFPLGTTTVLTTATDAAGNRATCPLSVTVVDKEPPQLQCPAPIAVTTAPGTCSAPVTFAPTATDTCSSNVKIVSTPASGSAFPLGTTTVITEATDAAGNTATCPLVVTVADKEAPSINNLVLTPTPQISNRDWVAVTVDYQQADNCRTGTCVLSVSGGETRTAAISTARPGETTEKEGSDSRAVNFIIVDAHHVQLSADRSGKGNSRTYTITVTCTDAAGNRTVKSAPITVQRD